jgi:16S rRNA (cytidine1402-2'-O)-methyltransferase
MLYVVATPIGNLDDITLRALMALKSTPLIIAENPSHTKKLLQHFQITGKELVQFAEHNELKVLGRLVSRLQAEDACLVSDAGTPGISDPGFRLVRACAEAGIKVVPVPGPAAAISALAASGLPTDKYLFVGFLPKTEPKLNKLLEQARSIEATLVAYESPQRIAKTMASITKNFPEANVVVARELTKMHEEFIRGQAEVVLKNIIDRPTIKGEITLLISFK